MIDRLSVHNSPSWCIQAIDKVAHWKIRSPFLMWFLPIARIESICRWKINTIKWNKWIDYSIQAVHVLLLLLQPVPFECFYFFLALSPVLRFMAVIIIMSRCSWWTLVPLVFEVVKMVLYFEWISHKNNVCGCCSMNAKTSLIYAINIVW